jgi:hypothetical protein
MLAHAFGQVHVYWTYALRSCQSIHQLTGL